MAKCPECDAEVCSIRVNGEWRLGDWGPAVPVVDLQNMVVAVSGAYSEMKDGKILPSDLAFDAWPIGGPPAAILVQIHNCKALVRYRGVLTSRGAEQVRDHHERRART